jgi:hypothetical protein
MTIKPVPVELVLPSPKVPRTQGVHLSSIIRCIAADTGILKKEWAEDVSLQDIREIDDPVAILRISIGLAWEQYYIPEVLGPLFGVVDHPGEMELDGIYLTPDGESISVIITDKFHPIQLVVHEVKATYKSVRTVGDLTGQWMWLSQVKAYCKAKGTRFAMLHVLFLCGDYSYPITPQLKCWQIEFTQAELDTSWDLLKEYRDQRIGVRECPDGIA